MKLSVKKIYCPGCRRLVTGQEKPGPEDNRSIQVLCSHCRRLLWLWNGIAWSYWGKASDGGTGTEPVRQKAPSQAK